LLVAFAQNLPHDVEAVSENESRLPTRHDFDRQLAAEAAERAKNPQEGPSPNAAMSAKIEARPRRINSGIASSMTST
jgi:hypothetical protein